MNIKLSTTKLASLLASEVECSVFEEHVFPVLERHGLSDFQIPTSALAARLITAAPELLEALKRIEVATMSMYATQLDMLKDCQDIARTAVAKVEGCIEATRQS